MDQLTMFVKNKKEINNEEEKFSKPVFEKKNIKKDLEKIKLITPLVVSGRKVNDKTNLEKYPRIKNKLTESENQFLRNFIVFLLGIFSFISLFTN